MDKPHKYSVALIIKNEDGALLGVKRPGGDKDDLPPMWGFPASSKKNADEDWETVAHRAAQAKLGVEIELGELIGEKTYDRGAYVITLRDYQARIISGEPHVPQEDTTAGTQYTQWDWISDPHTFVDIARHGSLCTQIFLEQEGIEWQE